MILQATCTVTGPVKNSVFHLYCTCVCNRCATGVDRTRPSISHQNIASACALVHVLQVARFHVIGVTAGVAAGTHSVAVVRPSTNNVLVTRNQGVAADATWTSSSPANIPNWVDARLSNSATTTSPVWQLQLGGGNLRVFVSSVALPSPKLATVRPRIAFAEVSAAGIGAFSACAGRGLPDTPVNRILVDGNTVYAATWFGVYRSTAACASFSLLGRGMPTVQVADLFLLPVSADIPAILRAGTWGRGAWELRL